VIDITTTLAGGQGRAAGTGMILTSNGTVLTNNHVIANSGSISAQVNGTGTTYTAKVVGYDPANDVAVLQLQNASKLPTVTLGDSAKLSEGDAVVAVGNALGRPGPDTVTQGHIVALNQ